MIKSNINKFYKDYSTYIKQYMLVFHLHSSIYYPKGKNYVIIFNVFNTIMISDGARIVTKPGEKNLQHLYRCLHKKLQSKNLKKLPNL